MSGEADHQGPPTQPRPNAAKDFLDRQRVTLVLMVLLVELAVFFVATWVPVNKTTQQALQKEVKNLSGATSDLSSPDLLAFIFTHNTIVAFGEMVPILGTFLWFISIYATGQVIQVVALSQGAPGLLYGVLILFFPFAIVELSAYAVAVTSGIMLIVAWRRHRLRRETRVLVLEAGLVAAMLLSAAALETVTIMSPTLGFSLWIPTCAAIAALVWISRGSGRRV
jgi:uncharacterized membrane protein SpoIIM required for sporulation